MVPGDKECFLFTNPKLDGVPLKQEGGGRLHLIAIQLVAAMFLFCDVASRQ